MSGGHVRAYYDSDATNGADDGELPAHRPRLRADESPDSKVADAAGDAENAEDAQDADDAEFTDDADGPDKSSDEPEPESIKLEKYGNQPIRVHSITTKEA
ncbi:hypothetical protein CYMTET_50531 [Cymbomonas tetramitiformis]|uniref:Uncharacterized protein n=1 Tax=Cymbomonas tetramitiformis TaxID=36881 RepID=A0AAE0BMV1_9CHLO|nr:hypothetical protein CYMTET_50531 [Cymbomonas tetramitiformis]